MYEMGTLIIIIYFREYTNRYNYSKVHHVSLRVVLYYYYNVIARVSQSRCPGYNSTIHRIVKSRSVW